MKGRPFDVVILSNEPWEAPSSRGRALAESWAGEDHRVFFVEGGQDGGRGLGAVLRFAARAGDEFARRRPRRAGVPKGVSVIRPLLLPATRRLFREANASLLVPRFVDLLHDRGQRRGPVVFVCGGDETTLALLDQLAPAAVAYDRPRRGTGLSRAEEALLQRADLIIRDDATNSGTLLALLERARLGAPEARPRRRTTLVSGLGWIGVLYTAARASMLLTQLIAGRLLGPEEYGRANLVIAVAAYLQIAFMLGFPLATSKLVAEVTDEGRRARLISTATLAFLGWTLLVLPIFGAVRGPLQELAGLPPDLLDLALLLSLATALSQVLASPLLGLKRFAHRGLAEIVYGFLAPILMVALIAAHGPDHRAMIYALCGGLLTSSAYALWTLRRYLRPVFDLPFLRAMAGYAAGATLTLLSTACVLAPARLFLNRNGSAHEVGLFSAYFTSTVQVALAFLYMLQAVLIPMASDKDGQRELWVLFRRWAAPAAAGAWILFCGTAVSGLALFGRRYGFNLTWAAAFAGAAAIVLLHGAVSALHAARDISGLRVSVAGALAAGLGNVALTAALVPPFGVLGAALSLILSFSAGLGLYGLFALWERRAG